MSFEVRDMQSHRREVNLNPGRLVPAILSGASTSQDCSKDCLDNTEKELRE